MKVLLIGGGAREHALARALTRSPSVELYAFSKHRNPGIAAVAKEWKTGEETDPKGVLAAAQAWRATHAVIGPEAPLAAGVSDALAKAGIHVAAPSKAAAEIETSKVFMRRLLEKHRVPGTLRYHYTEDAAEAKRLLREGDLRFAIKPVGLTGGKGVRVYGDHFTTFEDAAAYVDEVVRQGAGGHGVLLEELAQGEEFTLQALTDGVHILPTVAVQDHKRLLEGDEGPNTGGMGSYSQSDGLLPFLPAQAWEEAQSILRAIVAALKAEGRPYVGPIYGQFMLTPQGPRVIEVNARFGDPEAMNVLALLRADYSELVDRMTTGRIQEATATFESAATVVKYVVPPGYGSAPQAGVEVHVDESKAHKAGAEVYYASVDAVAPGVVKTTTSRAIAVLGKGETISEANRRCEAGLRHVKGPGLYVRHDIGTRPLIQRRLKHMQLLAR